MAEARNGHRRPTRTAESGLWGVGRDGVHRHPHGRGGQEEDGGSVCPACSQGSDLGPGLQPLSLPQVTGVLTCSSQVTGVLTCSLCSRRQRTPKGAGRPPPLRPTGSGRSRIRSCRLLSFFLASFLAFKAFEARLCTGPCGWFLHA